MTKVDSGIGTEPTTKTSSPSMTCTVGTSDSFAMTEIGT